MNAFKDLMFKMWEAEAERQWSGGRLTGAELNAYAAALGGEVDGDWINAPRPGLPAADRGLRVQFYSAGKFYIYAHTGMTRGAAYAHVSKKLRVVPGAKESDAARTAAALRIWQAAVSARGTIVETYLRSRCITLVPDCLRFHPALWHAEEEYELPAMVAPLTDAKGTIVAIHMTWLRSNGSDKAGVRPVRKTRGPIKGTAIRLAPLAEELAIGEGIETSLSVMQATGRPAWAAVSTYGLTALDLPLEVRSVTLLADGDQAGKNACRTAAARLFGQGRRVRIAQAPDGKDFNDLLKMEVAQ